ncbi:uncharacterized protein EV422DRAFT_510890 [Fimicolochytrium jonesii]|uniref:uncharacterized protein n=1 Tax=Fimicolochytrium jonesii TaxID=1396493 RepID=UPI0022FE0282|nr:uncharacterized protein EV422DRAFT_510890 [Fimicolochytrium jonesii]KAI8826620.1 hypothetical protein EV422DRAFT_510890 [Fimicolochytrium jonesii]
MVLPLGTPGADAIYYHVMCFVFVVLLMCLSIQLHGSHGTAAMKILLLQNASAALYFATRFIIVGQGHDPLCGGLTLLAGAGFWYSSLGFYYIIITQKTRALLRAMFPAVNAKVFIAYQVTLLTMYVVNVAWACALVKIEQCSTVWGGLNIDFIFTIVIQVLLLTAELIIYYKLSTGPLKGSKWTPLQKEYLHGAIALMVFLITSNIHIYYNWIATVTYSLWYIQAAWFSYVSYSTIWTLNAAKSAGFRTEFPVSPKGTEGPTEFFSDPAMPTSARTLPATTV